MRFKKGGIKTWLILMLVMVFVLGILAYLVNKYNRPQPGEVTKIGEKPTKGFAGIELSEEEKANLDNQAINSALISGDLADCEKITYDEELKKKCMDNINYAGIIKSGDEKQCEKLFDEKLKQQCYDKIYFSAAMESFDPELCKKISDDAMKQNCMNQIQVVMGRTATSEKDCDGITDSALKQDCLDNFYLSSGISGLDKTSCDKITDTSLKNRCTETIAQNQKVIEISKAAVGAQPTTAAETLKVCDTLSSDKVAGCKNEANYNLAFEKKDLSYCNRITDSTKQEGCIKEQTENLDQYYLRQAMAKRDDTVCGKISNPPLKALCQDSI
jgi:hypothetical protein